MAEVWRELPDDITYHNERAEFYTLKIDGEMIAGYAIYEEAIHHAKSINPTDALIDLLIWVRKEKP
jgi:hypothetical protein